MIAFGSTRYVQLGVPCDEAMTALNEAVRPGSLFALDFPGAGEPALRGWVRGHTFSVVRRAQVRNSFTPIVEGKVVPADGGSQLQLRYGLPAIAVGVLLVWVIVTAGFAAFAVQHEMLARSSAVFLALPLVGPLAAMVAFRIDVPHVTEAIVVAVTRRAALTR